MSIDFQKECAEGFQEKPEFAAGEGFAPTGGILDAYDSTDDVAASAGLFSGEVAISHESVKWRVESGESRVNTDEAMKDVGLLTTRHFDLR